MMIHGRHGVYSVILIVHILYGTVMLFMVSIQYMVRVDDVTHASYWAHAEYTVYGQGR